MQNKTILYATGIVALTAIVITCLIIFIQPQQEEKNINQLVNELQAKLNGRYDAKSHISIYFGKIPKDKAKRIANDLSTKLELPMPKHEELFEDSEDMLYSSSNSDETLNVATSHKKK